MTYLEGLSLLSYNTKPCRNAIGKNSTIPSSYFAFKLFQSLLGGKAERLCLLYHVFSQQCEKNLKDTKIR